MKNLKLIIVVWALLFIVPCTAMAAAPGVEAADPVFIFEQVPEGKHVSHEFILKNTGDIPVNILAVQPP